MVLEKVKNCDWLSKKQLQVVLQLEKMIVSNKKKFKVRELNELCHKDSQRISLKTIYVAVNNLEKANVIKKIQAYYVIL